MKKLLIGLGTGALCVASLADIFSPATPHIFYNKSASAPIGWYRLDADVAIKRDVLVAAFAPAEARNLAASRDYLPTNVPLIKTVWAVGGEEICSENGVIKAPNRPDIHASAQDGLGRIMPHWTGCKTLQAHEVFLISTHVQTSWDSRYFGPVSIDNVIGVVRFLGDGERSAQLEGGWARAKGVEGKIKGGSTPWALSPCLHIIFGGAPWNRGSTPVLAESLVFPGVLGGAPYPESHRKSRNPSW